MYDETSAIRKMPISFLPVITSGKIEEEGAIIECRNMNPQKRGRYKVYLADKSVPVPKVSLWRMTKEENTYDERNEASCVPQETVSDDAPVKFIDSFHQQAFLDNQGVPNISDVEEEQGEFASKDEYWRIEDEDFEQDEDCCDSDQTSVPSNAGNSSEADQPLYSGATITLATSMILLISYAMRHSLTGEAIADLLVLIDLHCLTPNLCQRNMKTFMDFFRNCKSPLQFHYYCENCFLYHGEEKVDMCPSCSTRSKKNTTSYFLVIPIVSQLSSLFADEELVRQIREYKASAHTDDNVIHDICDGKLYKERFRKDGYFHGTTDAQLGELHISLQMNTDGVSLFHSSNFSIWPIYFVINELPPHQRFSRKNRIFGGLWFGYSKPDFCTFLRPFARSLHDLCQSGLQMENLTVRGLMLNGTFDSPARCLFQNMTQFNGFYGCPYCHAPGRTVQTSERGHTLVYPFNMNSSTGYDDLRTHDSFTRNGEQAEHNKANGGTQTILGVKGLTWFSYLPNFDIIRGVGVDYMHCVLLGVVKMLLTLWFDKSHRNSIFSISSKIQEVDQRLLNIKPPSFITRLPRSLTEVSHYKAAEFKNFLLYYGLPCLYGILPAEQYHHFSLLVFSTYILLQEKISSTNILHCRQMIMEFVLNIPVLYGERYSTSNTHLLLHLTDKVVDLGPLWASSCFYFEDFNGQLRRLFHGTQHIETQIAFAVGVHQSLPKLAKSLKHGTSEKDLYVKMMEKKPQRTSECIGNGFFVVGAYNNRTFAPDEEDAICETLGDFNSALFFKRLSIGHQIVHSTEYKSTQRRNNAIVKYKDNFGEVKTFVKVIANEETHVLALIHPMERSTVTIPNCQKAANSHSIPLRPPSRRYIVAVPVKDICDVCVCVLLSNELCFVSATPNRIEKE